MPAKGTVFRIPGDSFAKLLPLFYKLPVELIRLRPAYLNLSRKVRELIGPGRISDQITSLQFAEFVWDCYAWTIWQCLEVPDRRGNHMKIPGNWVYYSGHFPLWELCYVIANTMVEKLESVERWNLQALFYFRSYEEIPWQSYEQFLCMVVYYTDLIIRENNWQPMIDEVWRHRQIEDYNGESVYKRDFMRSWTHSRSAEPPLSIEGILEAGKQVDKQALYAIPDPRGEFEAQIITDIHIEQFKARLTAQDEQILQMRYDGYTLKEIAKFIGFKTPSAVSKRIERIASQYEDFVSDKYSGFLDEHVS